MTAEQTETRKVRRGEGTLAVRITYTPRTGVPVRLYRLKLEVVEEDTSGCSPYVFVYQRSAFGKPMEDGSPRDEFVCVADELDEDEIPVNEPDMERNVPYYRASSVELLFRNSDMMYECARSIIGELTL